MNFIRTLLLLGSMLVPGNVVLADGLDFALGKALFDRPWSSAPSSTIASDGLGPLFNARACAACHPRGGRGSFREQSDGKISGNGLLLRIGNRRGDGDPVYGTQLQTLAIQGLRAEGKLKRLASGHVVATSLEYGPLHEASLVSGRLAPSLHGLGLLARVPEARILEMADPEDVNQDGISGRVNKIADDAEGLTLGRFGWKAGKTSVVSQSAAALSQDIGLSNPLYPDHYGDCTLQQTACRAAPHGGSPQFDDLEINQKMLELIAVYVSGLRPTKSNINKKGGELFNKIGCSACHRPNLKLDDGQTIRPFTDLLLHDMGASLADGIPDGQASGSEWRTPPLWGLGRANRYLHDGRARTIREAISYHDGEALSARQKFANLTEDVQETLIQFLKNL